MVDNRLKSPEGLRPWSISPPQDEELNFDDPPPWIRHEYTRIFWYINKKVRDKVMEYGYGRTVFFCFHNTFCSYQADDDPYLARARIQNHFKKKPHHKIKQNVIHLWQIKAKEIKRRRDQLRAERRSSSLRESHRRQLSPLRDQFSAGRRSSSSPSEKHRRQLSPLRDQLRAERRSPSSPRGKCRDQLSPLRGQLRADRSSSSPRGKHRRHLSPLRDQSVESSSCHDDSFRVHRSWSPRDSRKLLTGDPRKGSPIDRSHRGMQNRPSRNRWSRSLRTYQRDNKRNEKWLSSRGRASANFTCSTYSSRPEADINRFKRDMDKTRGSGQDNRTKDHCDTNENLLEHESPVKFAQLADRPRLQVKSSIF